MLIEKILCQEALIEPKTHHLSAFSLSEILEKNHPNRWQFCISYYKETRLKKSSRFLLDKGFKIDFLFGQKPNVYWGIDFTLDPNNLFDKNKKREKLREVADKEDQIFSMYHKGTYDEIAVEKMSIIKVSPLKEEYIFYSEETLSQIVEEFDNILEKMENSQDFLTQHDWDLTE